VRDELEAHPGDVAELALWDGDPGGQAERHAVPERTGEVAKRVLGGERERMEGR
jgi:hypothetical protein